MKRLLPLLMLCALGGAFTAPSAVAKGELSTTFECRVLYAIVEGLYIDLGEEVGLAVGLQGWLEQEGQQLARIQVGGSTEESSFLKFVSTPRGGFPASGQRLTLVMDELRLQSDTDPLSLSDTLKTKRDEEFVPLLAPAEGDAGVTDPQNVFHGRITFRQHFQETSDNRLDYQRSHLRTTGSLQRIDGTPWTLEWAGDLSYRLGDGLEDVDDFEDIRLELDQFAFSRRFDDESMIRIGRFIPRPLPSIGYVDGVLGEKILDPRWRVGTVLGFRPEQEDLTLTTRNPVVVPYATYSSVTDDREYTATGGLLLTSLGGELDRAALLIDQIGRTGNVHYSSSSEVDVDVGGADFQDGVRLTRWDITVFQTREGWTPRFGMNRFEFPDTEAQRDLIEPIVLAEEDFFDDDGRWRFWLGANHDLGGGFTLDEEVSYTFSEVTDEFHWRVGITKRSLSGSGSSTTLTVYNIAADEQQGYGARLSSFIPLGTTRRLTLQPGISFRYVDFGTGGGDFEVGEGSLRLHGRLSRNWTMFGGATYTASDDLQRVLMEIGLTRRW